MANDAYIALAWSMRRMSMRLNRRNAPTRSIRQPCRVAGDLGAATVEEIVLICRSRVQSVTWRGVRSRADVELTQNTQEIGAEADVAGERLCGTRSPSRPSARVEVLDRLGQVARVEERQADVLLEHRLLPRIAAVAVHLQIESRRFAEEAERLARRGRARGLLAGLEQVLLGLRRAPRRGCSGTRACRRSRSADRRIDPLDRCAPRCRWSRLARSLQHRPRRSSPARARA